MKVFAITGAAALAGLVAFVGFGSGRAPEAPAAQGAALAQATGEMVAVEMPALDATGQAGLAVFRASCAACHGPNAGGVPGAGPPLIHKIYEPGHHADFAFVLAVRNGVVAHHWRFGNMPPVEGVSDTDLAAVIAFVRQVQRANGIY